MNAFFNQGLLNEAKRFASITGDKSNPKPLPSGVKQYAIIGYGVSTLGGFTIDDWKPGTIFSGSYLELGNRKVTLQPVTVDGDGTVPMWSLETSAATKSYYIPYSSGVLSDDSTGHADLPANSAIQSLVGQLVNYENGVNNTIPEANPRPPEWRGLPTTPGKVLESVSTFELHSDAHLRISSANGKFLGYNSEGNIEETLPGTFLSMDGIEFASIADLNSKLKVTVSGIRDGKFTLDVNIKRQGSTLSKFSYVEVPVKNGTVAEVTMIPAQTSNPPTLRVTTNGKTNVIAASQSIKPGTGTTTANSGWKQREYEMSYTGTNLTYYQQPSIDQCQADCTKNDQCRGFTWIHPGTYNATDAAMCYLVSAISGRAPAKGHTSAEKTLP